MIRFGNGYDEIPATDYDRNSPCLHADYLTAAELSENRERFGLGEAAVAACQEAAGAFRTGAEIYPDYTFFELKVFDRTDPFEDDSLAVFLRGNLFLVVNVSDEDDSSRAVFGRAVRRFSPQSMNLERMVLSFFNELMSADIGIIESLRSEVNVLEEDVLEGNIPSDMNRTMLQKKKKISRMHNLYEQYLDVLEELETNENDVFATEPLMHISNLISRITRLKADVDSMAGDLEHITDAYFAHLDLKANRNMNYLTVLTTIFFPLTILVGWYGMNFQSMPEFTWKWGYLYVILLALGLVGLFVFIAKKKKWF